MVISWEPLIFLACFDLILKERLEQMRTSTNSRPTNYTSPRIQNEFIKLCGLRVLKKILNEGRRPSIMALFVMQPQTFLTQSKMFCY
jgi:hypothetical protein